MKNYFILLLCLFSNYILIAQFSTNSIAQDFNGDKVVDTLINEYESGSNFGGHNVTMINGKTNQKFTLSNYGCYCDFKKVVTIPNALTLDFNNTFLEVLKEKVLPNKREHPDSSLQWMISANFNIKKLKSHPLFDLIIKPTTDWKTSKLNIPETYYIPIYRDTLHRLNTIIKEDLTINQNKGFLIYYTSAHGVKSWDSLAPIITNNKYQIYKTPHTVFVKKDNTYKWMFLSDLSTTGTPNKLRWASIKQVELIDKYLIIHQDTPPNTSYSIYVVNIETQQTGRLKFEASHHNVVSQEGMRTFKLIDNQLVFNTYDKQELIKLPLQNIFNALDNQ